MGNLYSSCMVWIYLFVAGSFTRSVVHTSYRICCSAGSHGDPLVDTMLLMQSSAFGQPQIVSFSPGGVESSPLCGWAGYRIPSAIGSCQLVHEVCLGSRPDLLGAGRIIIESSPPASNNHPSTSSRKHRPSSSNRQHQQHSQADTPIHHVQWNGTYV